MEGYDNPVLADLLEGERGCLRDAVEDIRCSFAWRHTAEGADYWARVVDRLNDIANGRLKLPPKAEPNFMIGGALVDPDL